MLYNQPHGISDPNAAYINGNPTTGTMGSIPPAASIEYDQREIVAVIKWAADHGYHDYAAVLCQQPSNADLTQLLKAIFGIMNSTRLTAPQTYYVNTATGSDTNDGLTSGTAFKTLQKGANESTKFNLNGFSVTVNVADGTYGQVDLPSVNGSGSVNFIGNLAVPANCKIHSNIGPAIICEGNFYSFDGFRLESDAPDNVRVAPGAGVWSIPGGVIELGKTSGSGGIEYGDCQDSHIYCNHGVAIVGGSDRICGNAAAHITITNSGTMYCTGATLPVLTIPSAQTFSSAFAQCVGNSVASVYYSAMNGKANITGTRYSASTNGVVNTAGGGATYLPGTVAGVLASGGQYV